MQNEKLNNGIPETPKKKKPKCGNYGFTLMSELLVSVAITGMLSAIGTPTYLSQKKQAAKATEAVIAQVLTQAQAYNDEFGSLAEGWNDLDKIATIMT